MLINTERSSSQFSHGDPARRRSRPITAGLLALINISVAKPTQRQGPRLKQIQALGSRVTSGISVELAKPCKEVVGGVGGDRKDREPVAAFDYGQLLFAVESPQLVET